LFLCGDICDIYTLLEEFVVGNEHNWFVFLGVIGAKLLLTGEGICCSVFISWSITNKVVVMAKEVKPV
jgi:hypothetical protein